MRRIGLRTTRPLLRTAISSGLGWLLLQTGGAGVRAAHARSPSCEAAERLTLKNGIEIVLQVDTALPAVALVSSVHAGSRHDPPGYEGLAHYVEHLLFRAAPPFASPFDLYAEIGATGVNAMTSPDTTDYLAVVPAAQLERALWIEARRLAVGLNALEDVPALEERNVLLREHELRSGPGSGVAVTQATYEALFPAEHPYHSLLATEATIGALSLRDARWFFAEHYRPERVRLALVGDFEALEAKRLLERYWAPLTPVVVAPDTEGAGSTGAAAQSSGECLWAARPKPIARSRIIARSPYRNERLELFWPVDPGEDPSLLSGIFSVLARSIGDVTSQSGLSHDVSSQLVERELGSFWVLSIGVVPGQPFEKVEPLVQQTLNELRHSFPDAQYLTAHAQSLALTERREKSQLLSRALGLVRRECQASPCVPTAKQLEPTAFNRLDRFDPKKALIVERRFTRGASPDGDIEVLP